MGGVDLGIKIKSRYSTFEMIYLNWQGFLMEMWNWQLDISNWRLYLRVMVFRQSRSFIEV